MVESSSGKGLSLDGGKVTGKGSREERSRQKPRSRGSADFTHRLRLPPTSFFPFFSPEPEKGDGEAQIFCSTRGSYLLIGPPESPSVGRVYLSHGGVIELPRQWINIPATTTVTITRPFPSVAPAKATLAFCRFPATPFPRPTHSPMMRTHRLSSSGEA